MDLSPLEEYCLKIDSAYADKTFQELYQLALTIDPTYFTQLFVADLKYRANHQKNLVASVEGMQGSGKSLFSCAMGTILGNVFGNHFVIERDIYANPMELDYELRHGNNRRRTFVYDEQPQLAVGTGSQAVRVSLKDYEEICRYTQNNLIYCSPEVYDHAHYFVFSQTDYDPPRKKNVKCKNCPKFVDCHKEFYTTLCEIPFYERSGYPLRFNFLLQTKRLSDKKFIPRGIVSFPMVSPDLALRYNAIKGNNIVKFEDFQNNAWNRIVEELNNFVKEEWHEMISKKIVKDGTERYKVGSKELIRGYFYTKFPKNKFVVSDQDTMIALIKQKLEHQCEKLNNKLRH